MTGHDLQTLISTAPRTPWVWDHDGNVRDAAGHLIAQVPIENDHRRTATARLICEAANTMAPRVGTGRLTDSDAAKALRRRLAYLTARLRVPGLTNRLLEHRDHAATARALAWWDELQQLRKEARQ